MKRKRGFEENAATFSRVPVDPLSMQMTWSPRFRKLSQRCEPMKPAPPVIRTLAIASSYGKIGEAHFSQIVGVVDVSPVENDGLLQKLLNRVKVRPAWSRRPSPSKMDMPSASTCATCRSPR